MFTKLADVHQDNNPENRTARNEGYIER